MRAGLMGSGLPKTLQSSTLPVGATLPLTLTGSAVTLGDGSVWLKYGVLARAALYPEAAALEHLRAHGFSNTAYTVPSGFRAVATDGLGTFVVADLHITNVQVSTDYGQTWAGVAHGLGVNATDVMWDGTQFIVVGNDTTNLSRSTSPTGAVWTNTVTVGFSAVVTQTAKVAYSGGLYYFALPQNSGSDGYVVTSTTARGATTNRWASPPFQLNTTSYSLSAGGGRALLTNGTGSAAAKFTDGANGAVVLLPIPPVAAAPSRNPYYNGNFVIFSSASQRDYVLSTDLTTFSEVRSVPASIVGSPVIVGNRLAIAAEWGFLSTNDLSSWTSQSASFNPNAFGGTLAGCRRSLVFMTIGAPGKVALSTYDNPNYVGRVDITGYPFYYCRVA